MTLEDIILIVNKLGGVSFATLLALILWGGFKRIWVWGRDVEAMELRHANEKKAIYDDRDFWRNIAIRATGLAEVQGQILRVKETGTVDDTKRTG